MLEFWRSIRSMWSVVAFVQGIWSLIVLTLIGWFLGSLVLSSALLGTLLAISLPLGTIAALWWDGKRRAKASAAHRLFSNAEVQFVFARKMNEGKFPSENWATIAGGPAIVAFAHPLARRIPPLQRLAVGHLSRDRRRLAAAADLDDNWIATILVMPGKFPASSLVVDGKAVYVADLEATVDTFSGIHTPDSVRAKFLAAIHD